MSDNPLIPKAAQAAENPAVALIRAKVARAFTHEPDAAAEMAEARQQRTLSKHQRYMAELGASGKSLAEVQTAWHHYYTTLTDSEKHEVWQEFYDANQNTPYQKLFQKQYAVGSRQQEVPASPAPRVSSGGVVVADHAPTPQSPASYGLPDKVLSRKLKGKIAGKVSANGRLTLKHHLQSLGFGLATGFIVLVVFLFTFFNEYIIAPFIQPSRTVSSTPIILGDSTASADAPPSVTIPKINVQIPIDFSLTSDDENVIENGLDNGVVHYPSTVMPGQNGNAAFFGHSSGNIFNNGKYKFAFTLLHDLTTGDLFYVTYNGTTYAYRIFQREVVPPTDVGVINDTAGKQATAELITCDPPGISTNRLVLWGEQISPSLTTNTAAPLQTASAPSGLAGNGPTLWNKVVGWVEFWK
ncbi:MAG: sortase [Candidatus Saccharibacteria bacterium]